MMLSKEEKKAIKDDYLERVSRAYLAKAPRSLTTVDMTSVQTILKDRYSEIEFVGTYERLCTLGETQRYEQRKAHLLGAPYVKKADVAKKLGIPSRPRALNALFYADHPFFHFVSKDT
jgi:hypothetical protein